MLHTRLITAAPSWQQVEDTLCAAWEGGACHWLSCHGFRPPTDPADIARVIYRYQNALYDGGACLVRIDGEERELELTCEKLRAGVQILAEKYPRHYADMVSDDGDADTGDVFLQCCLLGELVYV